MLRTFLSVSFFILFWAEAQTQKCSNQMSVLERIFQDRFEPHSHCLWTLTVKMSTEALWAHLCTHPSLHGRSSRSSGKINWTVNITWIMWSGCYWWHAVDGSNEFWTNERIKQSCGWVFSLIFMMNCLSNMHLHRSHLRQSVQPLTGWNSKKRIKSWRLRIFGQLTHSVGPLLSTGAFLFHLLFPSFIISLLAYFMFYLLIHFKNKRMLSGGKTCCVTLLYFWRRVIFAAASESHFASFLRGSLDVLPPKQ